MSTNYEFLARANAIFAGLDYGQRMELAGFHVAMADPTVCEPHIYSVPTFGHDLELLDADYCSELGDCSVLNDLGNAVGVLCRAWSGDASV